MQLLRWFLTIFSLENDHSPVQCVGIMAKYIRNAISMFGNVDSRNGTSCVFLHKLSVCVTGSTPR